MNNTINVLARRMGGLTAVAIVGVSAVGDVEAAEKESERNRSVLEEIVVTAQKREQRLQEVPISISVLSGEDLDRSTAQGASEMLSRVPGVAITSAPNGGTIINIRGVGPAAAQFIGSSPSAYYLDSVPLGLVRSAIAPDSNIYDLDRIEVLRGPQGTLYGASALNGVVRVLTKDADLDELAFKARTSGATTEGGGESYRGDMAVNVPLVPGKLAARAVVGYQDLGGWIDRPNQSKEDADDAEIRNMRLKMNAAPSDQVSIGLSAWLSRADYGSSTRSDEQGRNLGFIDEPQSSDYDAYSLKIGYDLASFSVSSMTSYLDYEKSTVLEASPVLNPAFTATSAEVFAEEIIVNSTHDGPWRWSLGGFYRDGKERLIEILVPILDTDNNFRSKSFAAFGELTRLVLDGKIELTAGLRYFEDEVTMHEDRSVSAPLIADITDKFDTVSPRAVLAWHLNSNSTIYASYGQGFRSGFPQGPNSYRVALGAGVDIPAVKEDTLQNYEIGMKGDLWGGRVTYDVAFYYIDWEDLQQQLTVPISGLNFTVAVNSGSASGAGFDFGMTARPVDALEFSATFGWNDLTLDEDVVSGGFVLFDAGDRTNLSPEYTAGASADWIFPLGRDGFEGRLSAAANYTSRQEVQGLRAGQRIMGSGDNILSGRISISVHARDRWAATLFADNVNNERGELIPTTNASDDRVLLRPRTLGVQFEYSFY